MKDCVKCGHKAKTLYERHGEVAKFVATGYFICHACGYIFAENQEASKKAVGGVSLVVAGAKQSTVYKSEQDRIQTSARPLTVEQSAQISNHRMRQSGPGGTRTLDQLLRRQPFCPS